MKIRVTENAGHKITSGVSIEYRVRDEPYKVPRAIGASLIARGVAEELTDSPTTTERDV